jgi:oxygen-independent coproporphyrinogen-3 oxidase
MAGIYIHIPFCKKACHYCDFHFSTKLDYQQAMVDTICLEINQRAVEINEPLASIYFGGGTPSVLSKTQLQQILQTIQSNFKISADAEITLEANPDDMKNDEMASWFELDINRLSVGIQSFNQSQLDWMNRAHTAEESLKCIEKAAKIGFKSFSVDLIYGLPNLSNQEWREALNTAVSLGVNHLSTYCLTVETNTALAKMVSTGKIKPLSDEKQSEQFIILTNFLTDNGWDHYEISNSCKSGNFAKHNTAYWQRKTYLGIGPSAHSYNGLQRKWNIANNQKYMKLVTNNETAFEIENLSIADQINEFVLTGLRTKWGISQETLFTNWKHTFPKDEQELINQWCNNGLMNNRNNILTLTKEGRLYADQLASELFVLNT